MSTVEPIDVSKVRPLRTGAQPSMESVDATEGEARVAIAAYWRTLLRHKWSILALAMLGVAVGALKATSATPIYRAGLSLAIEPEVSNIVSGSQVAYNFGAAWRFYETQYEMLRSRAVAERVVDKLGLVHRKNINRGEQRSWLTEAKRLVGMKTAPRRDADTELAMKIGTADQEQARRQGLAGLIQSGVSVQGGEKSQIVHVYYESPNPEFAAEVTNALVDAYIELGLESRLDRTRRASAWLTERLDDLRKKVSESEDKLQKFQAREGMVDTKSMEQLTSTKLTLLNEEAVRTQREYTELSKRYGPKHPRMISAKAELDAARRRLNLASRDVVDTRAKEFELAKLEREVTSNRQLYEVFLNKFKETNLSTEYKLSNARVVDRATAPDFPTKPNKPRIMTTWGILGLALGVFLALMREQLHNKFRTNEEVEQKLALPVLGVMPRLKTNKSKRSRRSDPNDEALPERHFISELRSAFSEAVNHVRTGIMYSNVDSPPQTILVTSSVQAEGKTTLATNLAMSFSQLGRTLLIDADLRKPRVEQVTRVSARGGLVEYVAGTRTLSECVTSDADCPDLYVLKSGTIPPNPLELLSSKKLHGTIEELKQQFTHIVIDAAPVLPVSDAIVLAHISDALLMVIQADRTTHNMARDALRRLEASGIAPLGVVLTQVNVQKMRYYYDGKYQYYYGGYATNPSSDS